MSTEQDKPDTNPSPSKEIKAGDGRSSGLLRSSSKVGALTMLSRVLGLIRDMVFARYLGAGSSADAFFMAFKIPNFLRRLVAEGAFAQAFVPVLSEYRSQGSRVALNNLLDRVAGCLGTALLLITAVGVLGAPVLATLFAFGFRDDPQKFALLIELLRITFPYLFFIALTAFAGGILNSFDRFAIPAFTPVLLNCCLITAAIVGARHFGSPAYALAWGVFIAGALQLALQLPFLARLGLLPRPRPDWRDPGVRKILALMAPAMFGVSVSQINLLLDSVIASLLPTGSVSWLYYSDRLVELPLGVFAIAVATVILPVLSRQHAGADSERFASTLDWSVRSILLIALPAALGLSLLAEPILFTLFYGGETQASDISMSTFSLRGYAVGLLGFMLIKVLAPGYFARQDTRTPVRIGIIAFAANMVLNLIFALPLAHYFQLGHMGLALATSTSACLNAALLFRGLRRDGVFRAQPGWGRFGLQILAANGVMAVLLLLLPAGHWESWGLWQRCLELAWRIAAAGAAYAAILLLGGIRLRDLRAR